MPNCLTSRKSNAWDQRDLYSTHGPKRFASAVMGHKSVWCYPHRDLGSVQHLKMPKIDPFDAGNWPRNLILPLRETSSKAEAHTQKGVVIRQRGSGEGRCSG
ncbi:hypothetical protein CEXT_755191 [Caerostris extrusa]|uniref:Uncharacterized protein n=1 Tax=Caerostris extrusa TaxID=172846 RepID=A0AAV4NPV9_CAEEX|nr:hypothetical protein CEXT_755191 [Caerostris extrusa]